MVLLLYSVPSPVVSPMYGNFWLLSLLLPDNSDSSHTSNNTEMRLIHTSANVKRILRYSDNGWHQTQAPSKSPAPLPCECDKQTILLPNKWTNEPTINRTKYKGHALRCLLHLSAPIIIWSLLQVDQPSTWIEVE